MSVFLDQGGLSADAFSDCLQISRGDGNLGDTPVAGDASVVQLTYDGSTPAGPTDSNLPNDEPPAGTDENVMRAELGYCLRDVNNNNNHDDGCGHGDDCGGPPTPDSSGCFIVSASAGSPQAAEVLQLRALRDRVAAGSKLAARLIGAVSAEYHRFSPPIAAEVDKAAPARQAVLWVVVRPLLAWYALAGALAFERADRKAVSRAARALAGSCPRLFGKRIVTALLDTLRKGEALPPDAPALLQGFAPQIALAAKLPFAAWAILDALALAWNAGGHQRDAQEAVTRWLAAAPLEALPLPADGARLEDDLAALARLFDFSPPARLPLGRRLAARRPDAAPALARHGFLSAAVSSAGAPR